MNTFEARSLPHSLQAELGETIDSGRASPPTQLHSAGIDVRRAEMLGPGKRSVVHRHARDATSVGVLEFSVSNPLTTFQAPNLIFVLAEAYVRRPIIHLFCSTGEDASIDATHHLILAFIL